MSTINGEHGALSVAPDSWWVRLWRRFWALPLAIILGAGALGLWLPLLDEKLLGLLPNVFGGGADGARGLLSTIASAMISVTGLVFSITMIVLQLASSQFSPRVLGGFLESRLTQATFGVFAATFVFSLTVLRSVRGADDQDAAFVPQVSVALAFLLVVVSVLLLLSFIQHITQQIQVQQIISQVGDTTVRLIESMYPTPEDSNPRVTWEPPNEPPPTLVSSDKRHGVVNQINYGWLLSAAIKYEGVIRLEVRNGRYITEGQPLATVYGRGFDDSDRRAVQRSFTMSSERGIQQDPSFGVRQIVDVADRALSPGVNDPTTAVQCIDELQRILDKMVRRRVPSPYLLDDKGIVRVVYQPVTVAEMLDLAVDEIAHWGASSIQVPRRLLIMLDDLMINALTEHIGVLRAKREEMDHLGTERSDE